MKVGQVTKVKGDNITIQLSNDRTVTVTTDFLKLSVGDQAPEELVQAFDHYLAAETKQ
jgi:hypothetical protein